MGCSIRLIPLGLALVGVVSPASAGSIEFNRDVRPILAENCFHCHGPDSETREAGLRLDTSAGAEAMLESGSRALVPGDINASELVVRTITDDPDFRMPPIDSGKELSEEQVDLLRRWVHGGGEYQTHWSFQPLAEVVVPQTAVEEQISNPIDVFVLHRLQQLGWSLSGPADRATLFRRLHFDLLGLPPRKADLESFLQDRGPLAYERWVDRLLASPHLGERLASYWLDLVRYANTVGYHGDQDHAIAPYRDYVIAAFNQNMRFDRFTTEQLAGDLLPDATIDQQVASGYNRLLQTSHEGGVQQQEYLTKYAADRVRNLSSVWMGATVGCAECHDHKYDPYTQRDFYSLAAFFADIDELETFRGSNSLPTERKPELEVLLPVEQQELDRLQAELEGLVEVSAEKARDSAAASSATARQTELQGRRDALLNSRRRTMVTRAVEPRITRILHRGDWMDESGPVVQPAVPHFLPPLETDSPRATRLDLAEWLVTQDHPQTSRVFVNRVWYLFFGNGIAKSLDDTGSQGSWPTHPELLDYLATEFTNSGWNVKRLIRLIVTSATYRQTSQASLDVLEADPENHLYARQSRFRLPAEVIRDTALAVSGLLVHQFDGQTSRPYQPAGYYAHLNFPKRAYRADGDDRLFRRGVYMHWQRQFLHPMLRAFDAPTREECTAQRTVSNTPSAALTLLNDPAFVEAARGLASRILREGGPTTDVRARWAWWTVLSRPPTDQELSVVRGHYTQLRDEFRENVEAAEALLQVGETPYPAELPPIELAAWTGVSRLLLNLSETITRN